jgi:hypothetical protein
VAAAVAVKVAVVAPAATVTDGGTVSSVLLLAILTVVPPEDAACARVSVQVLAPPPVRLKGEHTIDEIETDVTVIVPPEDVKPTLLPFGSAPTALVNCIAFVVALAASVALTYATVPEPRAVASIPERTQVTVPLADEQSRVLPAEVAAGPVVTVSADITVVE